MVARNLLVQSCLKIVNLYENSKYVTCFIGHITALALPFSCPLLPDTDTVHEKVSELLGLVRLG